MGPYFAGIFDPRSWGGNSNAITLEVMRIVLATGLFAIGVELPKSYMAKHAKSLLTMVIPTMAIGWVIVAGIFLVLDCLFITSKLSHFRIAPRIIPSFEFHFLPGNICLLDANRSHHLRRYCR